MAPGKRFAPALFVLVAFVLVVIGASFMFDNYSRHLYVYKSTPQTELKIELFKPRGNIVGSILFYHSGGWWTGYRRHFTWYAEQLAKKGLIAARADYRVRGRHKTGIVEAIEDAGDAFAWFQQMMQDQHGPDIPIILAGGSSGGHLASMVAIEASDVGRGIQPPVAKVLFNPVLDLITATADKDYSSGELQLIDELSSEQQYRFSPGRNPHMFNVPTLLLFGSEDPLLVDAIASLDTQPADQSLVRLRIAQGENHGFFNRSPWREASLRELVFFLENVGIQFDPRDNGDNPVQQAYYSYFVRPKHNHTDSMQ